MNLYRNECSNDKTNAQRNLMGRTQYVDPDSLRYHKARILSARPVLDGILFAIVESVALDPYGRKRGCRFVIFDLFGNTVGKRADLDHCWKTGAAATKAMWAEIDTLNADQITLDGIDRATRNHEIDMQRVRDLLEGAKP